MERHDWARSPGNVGTLMITGVCMIAMLVLMLAYMDNIQLLNQKEAVGQLARKYILKMETVGYLTPEDRTALTLELGELGVTDINLAGSTQSEATYGTSITLQLQGKLRGEYEFLEKRVSTAKN